MQRKEFVWTRGLIVEASVVAALVLLWDSVASNADIPAGWLTLLMMVWAAELGVREVAKRVAEKKEGEEQQKGGE